MMQLRWDVFLHVILVNSKKVKISKDASKSSVNQNWNLSFVLDYVFELIESQGIGISEKYFDDGIMILGIYNINKRFYLKNIGSVYVCVCM